MNEASETQGHIAQPDQSEQNKRDLCEKSEAQDASDASLYKYRLDVNACNQIAKC